jgi:phenylalanyl-tRNA synthetase beta chain
MRPINNMVDATNYAMLELGEPLHAFDYDILLERADGQIPTIITRTAQQGEKLTTLDDIERDLDDFTVLVCDKAGPLSIAGVMGGEESEVGEQTRNVLLEGAAWNFINIRRTVQAQRMSSEAAYRFERGVHPTLASQGVRRGLELMRQWSGGQVCQGLVDNYPLPPDDPSVEISSQDVRRWLGIDLSVKEIIDILEALEFQCEVINKQPSTTSVRATTPPHRLDISEGITGVADLMEEIARIYGYDRIPETRMADELPPQSRNRDLEIEERSRDLLAGLGLQEVITHRLTSPEREARILPPETAHDIDGYFRLTNPISSDRTVLRHSLLASVLEIVERNARVRERIAFFEIAPVYIRGENKELPEEPLRLVIALMGPRDLPAWQEVDATPMSFYDLKGFLVAFLNALHLNEVSFQSGQHPSFHPGKCAHVMLADQIVGSIGELHPLVHDNYDLPKVPLVAADLDLDTLLSAAPALYDLDPIPSQPPVLEDLAFVVDEDLPAQLVAEVIQQAGGRTLTQIQLFDVYRGEQIAPGKKSLAYSLTYQDPERTLTDQEVAKVRNRIVRRLEGELGAKLRSL